MEARVRSPVCMDGIVKMIYARVEGDGQLIFFCPLLDGLHVFSRAIYIHRQGLATMLLMLQLRTIKEPLYIHACLIE